MPRLLEYMKCYPDITFDTLTERNLKDLADGKIEVLFAVHRFNRQGFVIKPYATLPCLAFASPSYIQQYGMLENPQDSALHVGLTRSGNNFPISKDLVTNGTDFKALSWGKELMWEQIVVDTGSTDRTVEIAERMGAKIYHFTWIDDFAAAKNYAIQKASGNWIAFLDADEYMLPEHVQKLPRTIKKAGKLGLELARAGATLVSGMAEGIDAAGIKGALQGGGTVVSVLGGGLDVVYPKRHRWLYEDVTAAGTLISEYPPGTEHAGFHFPVRNRIISGLSVGVIAVESGRYGGTLLTVNHASEQGREVFAVPGPVGAPESEGTNRLIQEGCAKLIMEADDVLCEFADRFPGRLRLGQSACLPKTAAEQRLEGAAATAPEAREARRAKEKPPKEDVVYLRWADCKEKLTDDQRAVLLALDGGTLQADDLVERTQIPARRVLSALTVLQIQGYAAEESGKRFRAAVKLKME